MTRSADPLAGALSRMTCALVPPFGYHQKSADHVNEQISKALNKDWKRKEEERKHKQDRKPEVLRDRPYITEVVD